MAKDATCLSSTISNNDFLDAKLNTESARTQENDGNLTTRHNSLSQAEILERWTENCSEQYTHVTTNKDLNVLNVPPSSNNARHSILRADIIEAVSFLKPGKSPGINNITGEMVQAGGEATLDMLLLICNKILQTGVWPKPWTQSLVITLPKKRKFETVSKLPHY
ncbi:endonuclease-reverse transcriptase [Elysia marginata]|uniref:Endonuclease-reverse transcriptase n=1 Tax=Elysia marginata TaxID=1093978 RepID=A0AAV4EPL4_9GAST|nr:endonuclease-reverse transcriptase [Elysia marginata]